MPEQETLFTRLYEQHYHRIRERASYLLGNPQEAEEITQETFLSAWRHLDNLTCEAAAYGWLYRIVSNKAIDVLRRRKYTAMASLDDCYDFAAPYPDVADEATSLFEQALTQLSPIDKAVCLLIADGYKLREIAEMLSKKLTASKMLSCRAKRRLRQVYEALEDAA